MAQIFHPSMNHFARGTIFGGVFIVAAVAWGWNLYVRSAYVTGVDVARDQPVPFSHDHHVSGLGIDCRYCHTTVEKSPFAGIPATEICMGCHSQIWKNSPLLAPVRNSYDTGEPLAWTRVHDLPDFVYFNHSIHVAKGIACESCHGRVDRMPLMRKVTAMHMEWCLACHEQPELAIRDKSQVFAFGQGAFVKGDSAQTFKPLPPASRRNENAGIYRSFDPQEQKKTGEQLVKEYGVVKEQLTNCVICHR